MLIEFRQSYPISFQQSNYDPGAAIYYAPPELSFETGIIWSRLRCVDTGMYDF
jgi:hypothetical protein